LPWDLLLYQKTEMEIIIMLKDENIIYNGNTAVWAIINNKLVAVLITDPELETTTLWQSNKKIKLMPKKTKLVDFSV
jgi:hypothetical protein